MGLPTVGLALVTVSVYVDPLLDSQPDTVVVEGLHAVGDATVVIREVGMSASEAGADLRLGVDPANVHLFDPNTTLRIG